MLSKYSKIEPIAEECFRQFEAIFKEILQGGGLQTHISTENGDIIGGVSKSDSLGITTYRKGFSIHKETKGYKAILPGVKGRVAHKEIVSSSEKEIGEMILDYYRENDLI